MSAAASSAVIVLPGSRVVARLRKRRAADALSSRYEQAKAWSTPVSACCSASTVSRISVPVLVTNGEADQIVPYATSGPRAVKPVQNGTLKTYAGYPHSMPTTHADVINADLLAFIQS